MDGNSTRKSKTGPDFDWEGKIFPPGSLVEAVARSKAEGRSVVFTNGCFDILHLGHLSYLRRARNLGDELVVALNGDESVKKLKGEGRPVNDLETRAAVVASLFFVDRVTWFDEGTPLRIIEQIVPDVLVKGGDWPPESIVGADWVRNNGGRVLSLPYLEGRSTTSLIRKIQAGRKKPPEDG